MTPADSPDAQPLPPGRRERAKADKRARILGAAQTLFAERGYERTSMSEVARRADVAAGTVFQYAATKSELLMMVTASLWPSLLAEQQAPTPRHDQTAAVLVLIEPFVLTVMRWPEQTAWVAREILFGTSMPHREEVMGRVEDLERQIARCLRPEDPAQAVVGARLIVTGVLADINRARQGRDEPGAPTARMREIVELVVRGLAHEG